MIINSRPDYDSGFYIDEEPLADSGDEDVEDLRTPFKGTTAKERQELIEWAKNKSIILGKEQAS